MTDAVLRWTVLPRCLFLFLGDLVGLIVAEIILFTVLGLVIGALIVWLFTSRSYWKGAYFARQYEIDEANDRAEDAVRAEQKSVEELDYLKRYLNTISMRPVVAMLSQEQFNTLNQNLVQYMNASLTDPSKMA